MWEVNGRNSKSVLSPQNVLAARAPNAEWLILDAVYIIDSTGDSFVYTLSV